MKILRMFWMIPALAAVAGATSPPARTEELNIRIVAEFGKSLDWHPRLNRIASARLGKDGYYDVFTMNPDGGDVRVLTDSLPGGPQKHNGNPCFHPSGKFLVFTGQNELLPDGDPAVRRAAVPGSGLGSDLFLADVDGRKVHQLTGYPLTRPLRAVIHPQFSKDGGKLAWSERDRRGDSFGGGWIIRIADFEEGDPPALKNIVTLEPGERDCFYEAHDFSADGRRLLFSGDLKKGQPPTGLDIYELDLADGKIIRLTRTDRDWDEHAHYSPDGSKIAWMSSAGFEIDYGPEEGRGTTWGRHLKTELWLMDADGSNPRQLTNFNTPGYPEHIPGARCIVSDSAWSPDGKSLIACVAWVKGIRRGVKLALIALAGSQEEAPNGMR